MTVPLPKDAAHTLLGLGQVLEGWIGLGSKTAWLKGVGVCGCFLSILFACRSVKASHVLISADGKVYLSGLRSSLSMISHGQRLKVVHDFPKYSIKVLPWLSPEVLQQVS